MLPSRGLTHGVVLRGLTVRWFPMTNESLPAGKACSVSSGESRAQDSLGADSSATGADIRHPSASLTIEATEADGFLVLELDDTPSDAHFGDFSDEARSGASGFSTQGVPQPALLSEVPEPATHRSEGEFHDRQTRYDIQRGRSSEHGMRR